MNEGHSAFLALERIRRVMRERGATFAVASEATCAGNVFTTHTPVPAGNDALRPAISSAATSSRTRRGRRPLGRRAARLGRAAPGRQGGDFSMPVLAIRTADHYNGVSELHGREARAMWQQCSGPTLAASDEIPIGSITNGVHVGTRGSATRWARSTRAYLGPRCAGARDDPALWARVHEIPDAELWARARARPRRLVRELAAALRALAERKGRVSHPGELPGSRSTPGALTIGFARRFATYKRGTLLLRDPERLKPHPRARAAGAARLRRQGAPAGLRRARS